MNAIKSLILGSAAVIAASVGAQAADLPAKAKAVQYVKICSLYGAGFYYIPGTDTCIKLGGYVQFDASFNASAHHQPAWNNSSNLGQQDRSSDYFVTRTRTQLNIDTRTASEYGVVRTFWSSNFQHTTGEAPSSGTLTVDFGFVQFAGFTLGKAISGFQTPWGATPVGLNTSNLLGGYDNATGITQVAYTWQFGNGLSAQLGVEDNRVINRAGVLNASTTLPVGGQVNAGVAVTAANPAALAFLAQGVSPNNSYGGNFAPDVVANIRLDSAAFTAQLSGAMHVVNATNYSSGFPAGGSTVVETSGNPDSKVGGAISGGIQLKNLPTGPGDKLSLEATWSQGSTKYVIGGTTGNNFFHFSSPSNAGSYASFAALTLLDGVYSTGSKIDLTNAWGFRGGYEHNWSKEWQTSLFGSYTKIDYNTAASANICAVQARAAGGVVATGAAVAASFANGYTCNPDFAIWQVGSRTAWTPVRNLTFSGEVMYSLLDQSNTGSITFPGNQQAGALKPLGTYDYKDQGIVSGNVRVRRTW